MKKNNLIWFDIIELERRLKNSEISDKDVFIYLLIYVIIFVLYSRFGDNNSWLFLNNSLFITIYMIMTIAIMIIGVKMTFNINSAGDNKDYFKRFLSLSFVTALRLNVFLLIPAVSILIFFNFLDYGPGFGKNAMGISIIALNVIADILYFLMLTNSFKRVCNSC